MRKSIITFMLVCTIITFAQSPTIGKVATASQTLSSGFWYTVKARTTSGINTNLPMAYALHQNYPNPFNPTTTIKFDLPTADQVSLKIYNIMGAQVAELVRGNFNPGFHTVSFDATGLSSGIYFYHLSTLNGKFNKVMKMSIIK